MRRREFITLIGGAATSWPLTARAQQSGQIQRIGVLLYWSSSNREGQAGLAAFQKVLQQAGWTDGVNIHFDIRWSEENAERIRRNAAELIALAPDVILANATPSVAALQSLTRSVPIVFVTVSDPVGAGIIEFHRAARRQCHGLYELRVQFERQMVRIVEAARAASCSGGCTS